MGMKIYTVDSFTEEPFAGNPAGVCILSEPRDENWMQNVAREMNLSETAFLLEEEDGFRLRWFTPASEVALCGHATLASAHILWETEVLGRRERARFHTMSGLLEAEQKKDGIEMDFPATPDEPAAAPIGLVEALGVVPVYCGKNSFDYIIEVESEDAVRRLDPDFAALRALDERGVMVTSAADTPGYDFVSRFFAPAVGINEDPVTGSAHCCLGPYWGARLGKKEMVAFQASARGGIVRVRLDGKRVKLGGRAITVIRGELADI
ncbi:MAG: PhzF family phenazine biosynthesis protein [Chitinivibrionia bacterium]|nr:PhzF family phenazine biosynthesis protein [Chitinivibrionia bacterium]